MARKLGFHGAAILLVLTLAPAGVVLAGAQSAAAGGCGSWAQQTSVDPGTGDNNLAGVAAISASNVWAVGYYFVGVNTVALIEHWDGTSWSVVPSPNVGTGSNELFAIRGTSSNSIWAVGNTVTSYPTFHTLILHWDGTKWRVTPSPSVGTRTNILNAVRPRSLTDAWAAGDHNNGTVDKTLILHWDGGHWRVWPSPNVGTESNDLNAIGGTSPTNAYAVGTTFGGTGSTTLILHWDGSHWRVVSSPSIGTGGNDLNAVFALSPASIWTAGDYNNGGPDQTLIEYCG